MNYIVLAERDAQHCKKEIADKLHGASFESVSEAKRAKLYRLISELEESAFEAGVQSEKKRVRTLKKMYKN